MRRLAAWHGPAPPTTCDNFSGPIASVDFRSQASATPLVCRHRVGATSCGVPHLAVCNLKTPQSVGFNPTIHCERRNLSCHHHPVVAIPHQPFHHRLTRNLPMLSCRRHNLGATPPRKCLNLATAFQHKLAAASHTLGCCHIARDAIL